MSESTDASSQPVTIKPRVVVRHLAPLLTWAFVLALFLWFFPAFKLVLMLVLAAAAVECALWPIVQRIHRPRMMGAMVVGVGLLALIVAAVAIVVVLLKDPIAREMSQLPETRKQLDAVLAKWSQGFGVQPPVNTDTVLSQADRWLGQAGNVAVSIGGALVGAVVAAALALIGAVYFLAESRDKLLGPLLPALPPDRRKQIIAALDELGPKLRWWLIGVLCSMTIVGVVSWIGYRIAGIKFALPLALLAGLGELVPTIGPMIGGVIAVAVGGTQGTGQATGAAITWMVVQALESYVLLPLIMRQAVKMPGVVTLFSVIFWGEVFGAPGLLLAIPINLVIWSFFKHLVIRPREATHSVVAAGDAALELRARG